MKKLIPVIIGLSLLVILVPSLVYADHGDWFGREHCTSANCTNFNPANEYRFGFVSDNVGAVRMTGDGGASAIGTGGHLAKVFDKAELDGKLITWEYSREKLNGSMPSMNFYDGVIDPNKFGRGDGDGTPISCGTDCFQDQGGVIVSAGGGSVLVMTANALNSEFTIKNKTGSVNLSSFDSPSGKVTLSIFQPENSQALFMGSNTYQVTIEDLGTFRFKSDASDPSWDGSVVTCLGNDVTSSCTTANVGLKEETNWSVTSRPPTDVIPPVISIPKGEPVIFYDGDSIFDFVNCSDDLEVLGHPIDNFDTDGGVTIDGENTGLHEQDFTCTDEEGNETLITVDYLVKRLTSGGGAGGSDNTMLPPSSSENPIVQSGSERGLDLLSFLGDNDITDGEVTFDSSVSAPSTAPSSQQVTTPSQSASNAIANFFSNLFCIFGNC